MKLEIEISGEANKLIISFQEDYFTFKIVSNRAVGQVVDGIFHVNKKDSLLISNVIKSHFKG